MTSLLGKDSSAQRDRKDERNDRHDCPGPALADLRHRLIPRGLHPLTLPHRVGTVDAPSGSGHQQAVDRHGHALAVSRALSLDHQGNPM